MHIFSKKSHAGRSAESISKVLGQPYVVKVVDGGFAVVLAAVEKTRQAGRARTSIIEACSRPEGATPAELYAATAWKDTGKTNWRSVVAEAGKATDRAMALRKVDGKTRYFLIEAASPMDDFNYVGSKHHY